MVLHLRRILSVVAVIAVVLSLLSGFGWWSIRSGWFANLVRARILATLEKTTGGRVELGGFTFDPDSLHATVSGLVIHGKEPQGSPALLSVAHADVGLKILSVLRQEVDVESLRITRPEIHLTVNTDGSTNLPPFEQSSKGPMEQLLDLKAKRIEVVAGMVAVNDRKVPFAFSSRGTELTLNYVHGGPDYGFMLDADAVNCSLLQSPLRPMHVAVKGGLYSDRAVIEELKVDTGKGWSSIQISGEVAHFEMPVVRANIQASLSIDELAKFATINDSLQNGRIGLRGIASYRTDVNQFTFKGNADAHNAAFVSPAFTLREMSATAVVTADNGGMILRHCHAAARGALFSGDASIKAYRYLQVQGEVSQVALKEVGSYLTKQEFPWSGMAHGQAHASAKLGFAQPEFVIGAKVDIDGGTSGIPVSGNVEVTYYNQSGKVEFGNSALQLPHTKGDVQGTLDGDLQLKVDTHDLADLRPLIPILGVRMQAADLPKFVGEGRGQFAGALHDVVHQPLIKGAVALKQFKFRESEYVGLKGEFALSANEFSASKFKLDALDADVSGSGRVQLTDWVAGDNSPFEVSARFANVDVVKAALLITAAPLPLIKGVASGNFSLDGSLNNPHGHAACRISNLDAFGEQINQMEVDAGLTGNRLVVTRGRVQSGKALLSFSGAYEHNRLDWFTGNVDIKVDTNGFPLSNLATVRKYVPGLDGRAELHLEAAGKLRSTSFEPLKLDGNAELGRVSLTGRELGNVSLRAATEGNAIEFKYSGAVRDANFRGGARAELSVGTPIRGDVQVDKISLATAKWLTSETKLSIPVDGFLDGNIAFDGALEDPLRMHARATIEHLQIHSIERTASATEAAVPSIVLGNKAPIVVDVSDGLLNIESFEIDGRDTSVTVTGSAPFRSNQPIRVKAVGNADLVLFKLFDPNVRSAGHSELSANISGTLAAPNITGTLKVQNGSFFFADVPNGLSDVDGLVVFSRNRATIQKMTAHSGGGEISLGGSLSFGEGSPLVYHLEAAARNVRVRYANSISVTGNSDLRFSGTSLSSLLSGTLTVTRVVFTPNTDAGNLLAAASAYGTSASNPEDFISGLHLDVGIESAPNLQVSTNLSRDVEAEIQLRVRGTPDHPMVFGSITANQGDIKIFGTRFSLNRGEISFVNAIRVEPVLDLDLETQARGVTVDITVSGPPSKLNFNYRSDPPLQPRDIIALLTVGRAPDVGSTSNAQGARDVSALTSGVNSVLGSAISPVSNRLSKLFGVTNIRIDPFVQGITNTPQARLSVEQQISRDVTVTYITNLAQTSEQIFRFEWALNRQFSIVAIRDDNGEFGLDFQIKKRFK